MGVARIRRLTGDTVAKGPVRRPRPDPLTCAGCGREISGEGESGLCSRCYVTAYRVATTGSPNRRLINQPSRRERRMKKKGSA